MAERILEAVDRLFYAKGIRAVGVDAIAAEAGISKRSLYDTFPSKEALIEAYLLRRIDPLPEGSGPPIERVLHLFEQLHAHFAHPQFRGCPFVNAVAEMGDACGVVKEIAVRIKAERQHHIEGLLNEAGVDDPARLASYLGLLLEGAVVSMLVLGDPSVARVAGEAARALLAAQGVPLPEPAPALIAAD